MCQTMFVIVALLKNRTSARLTRNASRNMRVTEGWLDRVQVVHMDMRDFNPPVKADILVR
jgi:tRNA1(Val) A37 N6-methylase TrmN6